MSATSASADAELAGIAKWRVQKIINEDELVAALNEEHGVLVGRAEEQGFIDSVIAEIAAKRPDDLYEIHKGWGGSADPRTRTVYLQRFKSPDDKVNRRFMWRQFQTMIHEYIHTLNHSRFRQYSSSLTDDTKSHALREGMTDYLTKVVWSTVKPDAVRATVEGPFHDPTIADPVPELGTYDAAIEAEQVVGLVGAPNAFAAYFLGHVELIGGVV